MAKKIDQKAYLQKYLNGPSGDKKKKKKKNVIGKGLKIVDDDIDVTKLRPLDGDDLDLFDEGEDAPQIAGIIDERPDDVKKLEQFKTTSKWKVINQDDGFNSKLQIEEIKKDIKETEKENELVFGKMYSDSEDEDKKEDDSKKSKKQKSDSDVSPPRRNNNASPKRLKKTYDSDQSPPRKSIDKISKRDKNRDNDSDASPPRKHDSKRRNNPNESEPHSLKTLSGHKTTRNNNREKDKDSSPPRRRDREHKSSMNYDTDLSPPRKLERARKPTRWGNIDDAANSRNKSRSNSPKNERKSRKDTGKRTPSSDLSPPRKSQKVRSNKSPDSDLSPPRKRKSYSNNNKDRAMNKHRRDSNNSDLSPPRKRRQKSQSPEKSKHTSKRKHDSDSDLSPPRKDRNKSGNYRRNSNSPPPSNKKMARTLEGKMAGLQDAKQLRQENEEFRKREEDVFKKMTDDVSGRNAKAVSRKSKRDTSEDRQKQRDKADRQKELDEKYKKWSRGVKQMEDQQARVEEFMHEAAKPLARMKGDRDLEAHLKREERQGDPMLNYIRDKKRERGELGPEKPSYKGQCPPNRFDIRPGYRWDGVDRSNGYENKYFEQQSKRKAQEEEAYKWSTEDL